MKLKRAKILWKLFGFASLLLALLGQLNAQSGSVEYPTAVTESEINGQIAARDIGDSRSTTHYYVFNSGQGDLILTIEAQNLNADIDVFYADNLRPVSKISIFSDNPGRISRELYFRKFEKLILKIEGKSAGDDAARYKISFSGSFQPFTGKNTEEPEVPTVKKEDTETDVVVNSVGTIIEVKPKPVKTAKAESENKPNEAEAKTAQSDADTAPKADSAEKQSKSDETQSSVTEDLTAPETPTKKPAPKKANPPARRTARNTTSRRRPAPPKKEKPASPKPPVETETAAASTTAKPTLAEALEKINLVILLKDGSEIRRPMSEVTRVAVDRGMLTVIAKDGKIQRFSILDVAKFTIE